MKNRQRIRYAVLAAILGTSGISGGALAVNEIENNHPIQSAQKLTITGDPLVGKGGVTVDGVIGKALTSEAVVLDADFYSFYGREGDIVTIKITGGAKRAGTLRSLDAFIALYKPGAEYTREAYKDDVPLSQPIDPGSINRLDPRIENVRLPVTGIYTVGVSGFPVQLLNGGVYSRTDARSNGSYILTISGVSLPVTQINIDIKPGSGETAPINPKSKGVIPVALLSSAEFDALTVDLKTLTFGSTGNEPSYVRCNKNGVDFNGDGRLDLLCHFENQLTKFDSDDVRGTVKGRTLNGMQFEGRGMLKIVPVKREE